MNKINKSYQKIRKINRQNITELINLSKMNQQKNWNDHVRLGQYELSSRVVLTSLTRMRCNPKDGIPNQLLVQYYSQRAGAALILTQCAAWSQSGQAYPGAANLYNKQQAEGWKKVVDAVHKKGSKIYIQIFHAGRATHPKLNGNKQVISSSPIANREGLRSVPGQKYPVPKEMTLQDIKQTQEEFRKSILLAKQAGFDGIQLHGSNGYIIDQFLKSFTNKRTDNYGGSVENRIRFCLQLIDIALEHWKPYQVAIKLSPVSQYNDMFDQNPEQTFGALLRELSKRNIGFVEIRESTQVNYSKSNFSITPPEQIEKVCKTLRPYFKGLIIANDSFTAQKGIEAIREGWADLVSFGRLYICNPDLTERILNNLKVNPVYNYKTFFTPGPQGYIDYPFYEEWIKSQINPTQKL